MSLDVPAAQGVQGRFAASAGRRAHGYSAARRSLPRAVSTIDVNDAEARSSWRARGSLSTEIPRADWRFTDPGHVELKAFRPGSIYGSLPHRLSPSCAGVPRVARHAAWLRWSPAESGTRGRNARAAYSRRFATGRFSRTCCSRSRRGRACRMVFGGIMPHVAAPAREFPLSSSLRSDVARAWQLPRSRRTEYARLAKRGSRLHLATTDAVILARRCFTHTHRHRRRP